jgi:acyl-CoA oxidase
MGRFANHAAVFAKILVPEEDGEINDYGIGVFIVQIRDRDTHKHMKGIKCGDLGPKMGYHGKDNGWLTFDHVKVPRN